MAFRRRQKLFTGCDNCRTRRKKCDEAKPTCLTCQRLDFVCSWGLADQFHHTKSQTGIHGLSSNRTVEIPTVNNQMLVPGPISPQLEVQNLRVIDFRDSEEELVIRNIPDTVQRFFAPAYDHKNNDASFFMQMALRQPMVRDAMVTCFSSNFPSSKHDFGDIDRVAYGRALQTIQKTLRSGVPDAVSMPALQMGIQFLGLMETISTTDCEDPTKHWRALATLVEQMTAIRVPRTIYRLILEAIIFNISTLAIFSTNSAALIHAQGFYYVYRLLCEDRWNSDRIADSPFMSRQYELYKWIFEVTHLSRCQPETVSKAKLENMEIDIRQFKARIDQGPEEAERSSLETWQSAALSHRHHLICVALLLCVVALHSPSEAVSQQIDDIVSEGLDRITNIKLYKVNRTTEIWPLQIIACGVRTYDAFQKLRGKWNEIKQLVDAGHHQRGERLLDRINEQRKGAFDPVYVDIPRGLYLLREKDGVLERSN